MSAARAGGRKTAVYLAAFDEVVDLFHEAAKDPVVSSVPWYGSDGVALSRRLAGDRPAASFASHRRYPNPTLGLDSAATKRSAALRRRARARLGSDPDALALAAYDALQNRRGGRRARRGRRRSRPLQERVRPRRPRVPRGERHRAPERRRRPRLRQLRLLVGLCRRRAEVVQVGAKPSPTSQAASATAGLRSARPARPASPSAHAPRPRGPRRRRPRRRPSTGERGCRRCTRRRACRGCARARPPSPCPRPVR